MKRIFKYRLTQREYTRHIFPAGAKLLSVKAQYGDIVLYALVNEIDRGEIFIGEEYDIYIKGTGHIVDDIVNCEFLGTVKLKDGKYMWHIFYKKVEKEAVI